MAKQIKPKMQDYSILQSFRLNGKWHHPDDGALSLTPSQASMLLLNGKVGQPQSTAKAEAN
ncbi:MAG: hypothetical protein CENE_03795 [Candidatus Celerinatantimonas neptuna]|nr:MAG: hypothetical protein CENE_03795 [Candidatus Celerinatantimonas neptuna]